MKWQIFVHREQHYGEVITSGIADMETSAVMVKEISKTMRQNHATHVLIDHRAIEGFSGNPVDIYVRP